MFRDIVFVVAVCIYGLCWYSRDLSLNGNVLGCEGTQDLMSPLLHLCTAGEPLPPLAKVLLQDNSIDAKGKGGTFGPVICMRAFRR